MIGNLLATKSSELYTTLILVLIIVVFFTIQLLFCLKWKRALIKIIPIVFALLATTFFFIRTKSTEGFEALGPALLFIYCAILTLACAVSWVVYAIVVLIKRRGSDTIRD